MRSDTLEELFDNTKTVLASCNISEVYVFCLTVHQGLLIVGSIVNRIVKRQYRVEEGER